MAENETKEKVEFKPLEQVKIDKIKGLFTEEMVIADKTDSSMLLYNQSRYGEVVGDKIHYSLIEALYLIEKNKLELLKGKKALKFDGFVKKVLKKDKKFLVKYYVYKDMRNRGYIVKTALKFGAEFRVYDRGVKPGEDHAKWVLYPVHESDVETWYNFAAKNRVAHSTRKRLLIGIVDEETDVTYYTISWERP